MRSIDYSALIKNSWQIAWKNRFLWWFGLLISIVGGLGSMNNFTNFAEEEGSTSIKQQAILNFIQTHLLWIIAAGTILFAIYIIFAVISIIARAGLIESTERVIKNEPTDFKSGMKSGKKFFWRMLGIKLTLSFFVVLSILILLAPVIFLVYNKDYLSGIILGIISVLIIIGLSLLSAFLNNFGQIYIVLGNLSVFSAIENAYALFRKNIANSLILLLLFIPLGIAIACVFFAIFLILIIILGILGFILYYFFENVGLIIIITLGFIILVPSILLVQSVFEVFSQTLWLLYFNEIAKPKEGVSALEELPIIQEKNPPLPDTNPLIRVEKESEPGNEN